MGRIKKNFLLSVTLYQSVNIGEYPSDI